MSSSQIAINDHSDSSSGVFDRHPVAGSYAPGRPGWQAHKNDQYHAFSPEPQYGQDLAEDRSVRTAEARLARDQALAEFAQKDRALERAESNQSSTYEGGHSRSAWAAAPSVDSSAPNRSDRIIGTMEKVLGNITHIQNLRQRGEARRTVGKKAPEDKAW